MSVPESAGLSLSAYQPGLAVVSVLPSLFVGSSETTTVPTGTSSTIPSRGRFWPVGLM